MEYADNGDLLGKIKEYKNAKKYIPEEEIMSIFVQVVNGLK